MSKLALYSNSFGSGKSTVAKLLVKEHGYTLYTLATKLKDLVHSKLDKMGVVYDVNDKLTPIKGKYCLRDFYIDMGVKLGEKRGATWMIDPDELSQYDNIVIDDLRRPEELAKLVELGFTPIFIDRALPTPDNPLEGLLSFDALKHVYFPNLLPKSNLPSLVNLLVGKETLTSNTMFDIVMDVVENKGLTKKAYTSEATIDYSLRNTKTYSGLRIKHNELGVIDIPVCSTPHQLNSLYLPIRLLNSLQELNVDTVAREISYQTSVLLQLEGDTDV
jgi:hypothetical protein